MARVIMLSRLEGPERALVVAVAAGGGHVGFVADDVAAAVAFDVAAARPGPTAAGGRWHPEKKGGCSSSGLS